MLLCLWISQKSVKDMKHAYDVALLSYCQDHMQKNFLEAIQRRWY